MDSSNSTLPPRLCQDCDIDIADRDRRSKRCLECQTSHQRGIWRTYRRNRLHSDHDYRERQKQVNKEWYAETMADSIRRKHLQDKQRAIAREWQRKKSTDPQFVATRNQRRRVRYQTDVAYRERQLVYHRTRRKWFKSITPNDVQKVLEFQKWQCSCCGTAIINGYQLDHILPIALGGQSVLDNLQLLCAFCNGSKGARTGYFPPQGGQGFLALGI